MTTIAGNIERESRLSALMSGSVTPLAFREIVPAALLVHHGAAVPP
jgi:hypothetical protein